MDGHWIEVPGRSPGPKNLINTQHIVRICEDTLDRNGTMIVMKEGKSFYTPVPYAEIHQMLLDCGHTVSTWSAKVELEPCPGLSIDK